LLFKLPCFAIRNISYLVQKELFLIKNVEKQAAKKTVLVGREQTFL
jgi:hypothetical protein